MPPSIAEITITLFFITFFVALVAFAAYGYMMVLLLKNHSEKFNPKSPGQFLKFLWDLLMYYISRSFVGFLGYNKFKEFSFYIQKDEPIRAAESEQQKLSSIYNIFSAMYLAFMVLGIITFISFLYWIADGLM